MAQHRHQIALDPELSMASIARFLGPERGLGSGKIPIPDVFKQDSPDLQRLRAADMWKNDQRDEQTIQMGQWFPDLPYRGHPKHEFPACLKAENLTMPSKTPASGCPNSDIGTFDKLPGEVRNRIYRLVVLEPDHSTETVENIMEPMTCGVGPCLHSKVTYNLPGLASTCRQLRWEVTPIYCAENLAGFSFDQGMVQQHCAARAIRTLGNYADLIRSFHFIFQRPLWNLDIFMGYAMYKFRLTPPACTVSGKWELVQFDENGYKICQCGPNKIVARLMADENIKSIGEFAAEFADDDALDDFIWRAKKTKQWPQHLTRCRKCDEVVFNN